MKNSKLAKRNAVLLNMVIHTRNLYSGHSRFVNAQPKGDAVVVENLQTGELVPYVEGAFRDGYGNPVTLN